MEQEEAGEPELVDQRELLAEPPPSLAEQRPVARWVAVGERGLADLRELPDRRLLAVGEVGVAVAELGGEVELEPLGELDGSPHGVAVVGEELVELGGRAQDALAVAAPLALAAVERGALPDRDEHVLERGSPRASARARSR